MIDEARDAAEAPRMNRRQAAKVRTRQKVLDAARKLFSQRGYEAATIRDIAGEAGMSTGAVFANFQDKSELFDAVLAGQMETVSAPVRAAADAESTLKNRLNAGLRAAYVASIEQLPFVQAVMARAWFQPAEAEARMREQVRPTFAFIAESLQTAIGEGELRQDVDVRLLTGMIYDTYLSNYRRAAYENWSLDEITARMREQLDIILAGGLARQ